MEYTLAQLEKVTGVPRRALQFWTDRGAIHAAKGARRGVHRRFTRDEAIVASILNGFAYLTIADLEGIARVARAMLTANRESMEMAIAGEADVLCLFERHGKHNSGGRVVPIPRDRNGQAKELTQAMQLSLPTLKKEAGRVHAILLGTYTKGLRL